MKVLWVCNIMLPVIAEHLDREASNKEGWLSGLCNVILERQKENGIELHVAFPVEKELDGYAEQILLKEGRIFGYGFYEDVNHAECYDEALESRLWSIADKVQPDVIHCFGTEYAHTLAMCRAFPRKNKILIGIQGLCAVYANTYFANLPKQVIKTVTLRDKLKKDSIIQQYEKFVQRGNMEMEAIRTAGNITGRTAWDHHYAMEWNPHARYYMMNETLRSNFYQGKWDKSTCVPYSIFLSQGDYPIKGLHYMLLALSEIREKYPQVKVYVAGNSIVKEGTLKEKLKISAYGKYISDLIKKRKLESAVEFLGRLDADAMKKQYLKSHLFVCCSTIENSPNSLGEAMLLGMPCVSADVGGIESIFNGGEDGILYRGYRSTKNSFDNTCDVMEAEGEKAENAASRLAKAIIQMWDDEEKMDFYCENARKHARKTHDREENYKKMMEIYAEIAANGGN